MKRRLEVLARIGKLQRELHELASWRLAQIGRQLFTIGERDRSVVPRVQQQFVLRKKACEQQSMPLLVGAFGDEQRPAVVTAA